VTFDQVLRAAQCRESGHPPVRGGPAHRPRARAVGALAPRIATPQNDETAAKAAVSWWTRSSPIRTAGEVVVEFVVVPRGEMVWQRVEGEVRRLRGLGMTLQAIGRALGVDETTVRNVLGRSLGSDCGLRPTTGTGSGGAIGSKRGD
jgi:hypothetical protein